MASAPDDDEDDLVQEESGARVHFADRDPNARGDEDREVIIRGTTESAQKAEVLIHKIIADMPVTVTELVEVPGYCLGRIIGKGGESIRDMSRTSRCRIFIDRQQDSQPVHLPRSVTITGPQDQIQLAKTLIAEKVEEEEVFRAKRAVGASNREQRNPQKRRPDAAALVSRVVQEDEGCWDAGDRLVLRPPDPVKQLMEIFVSASLHPGTFWVQMVSKGGLELDKLVDEMTAFYSNDSSKEFSLSEVKVEDVVAAPFSDGEWYRGKVLEIRDDDVDVFFPDYGDFLWVKRSDLRELRPQYWSLPIQAVECKLAGVKPVGESWEGEAADVFFDVVKCARWIMLSARTVGYHDDQDGRRLPCLQIFSPADDGGEAIDVAAELVTKGLAVWDKDPTSAPTHTPTLGEATTTQFADAEDAATPSVNQDKATAATVSTETVRSGLETDLDPVPEK